MRAGEDGGQEVDPYFAKVGARDASVKCSEGISGGKGGSGSMNLPPHVLILNEVCMTLVWLSEFLAILAAANKMFISAQGIATLLSSLRLNATSIFGNH